MVADTSVEAKIIKQVEYYFSDLNLSRDKFMKQVISENDGWISFETLLKFNRLKSISDDVSVIKEALSKSNSGLLEIGEEGVRRCPDQSVPDSFDEVYATFKDRSIYVKGFPVGSTLDEIMEFLELHGGKVLNVHMRRLPSAKTFKGSIFAVFQSKEDADRFLSNKDSAEYKGNTMLRMYRENYWQSKQKEKATKEAARAQKTAAIEAHRSALVDERMSPGALLELSGLPKVKTGIIVDNASGDDVNKGKDNSTTEETASGNEEDEGEEQENEEANEKKVEEYDGPNALTVIALKQWIAEKVGAKYPVAWIDVEPAAGKAVVRFKEANTSEPAWAALKEAFGDKPVIYANSELSGRVLSGDEEKAHWKHILSVRLHKAQKRRGNRSSGKPFANKRRRRN